MDISHIRKVEPAGIESVKDVLDNGCATFIWDKNPKSKMLVDSTTANMLVTVYDALNDKNQQGFSKMIAKSQHAFMKMVDLGWSCVK